MKIHAWYKDLRRRLEGECTFKETPMATAVYAALPSGHPVKICHFWGPETKRYPNRIEFLLGYPGEGLIMGGPDLIEYARASIAQHLNPAHLRSLTSANPQLHMERDFDEQEAEDIASCILEIAAACRNPEQSTQSKPATAPTASERKPVPTMAPATAPTATAVSSTVKDSVAVADQGEVFHADIDAINRWLSISLEDEVTRDWVKSAGLQPIPALEPAHLGNGACIIPKGMEGSEAAQRALEEASVFRRNPGHSLLPCQARQAWSNLFLRYTVHARWAGVRGGREHALAPAGVSQAPQDLIRFLNTHLVLDAQLEWRPPLPLSRIIENSAEISGTGVYVWAAKTDDGWIPLYAGVSRDFSQRFKAYRSNYEKSLRSHPNDSQFEAELGGNWGKEKPAKLRNAFVWAKHHGISADSLAVFFSALPDTWCLGKPFPACYMRDGTSPKGQTDMIWTIDNCLASEITGEQNPLNTERSRGRRLYLRMGGAWPVEWPLVIAPRIDEATANKRRKFSLEVPLVNDDFQAPEMNPPARNLADDPELSGLAPCFAEAFNFAAGLKAQVDRIYPGHRMELWDAAAQWHLNRHAGDQLPRGRELLLEKCVADPEEVWKYGTWLHSDNAIGPKGRSRVLPDGVLIGSKTYAVELDHGSSAADWSAKLEKAARNLLSSRIDGLIYTWGHESSRALPEPVIPEALRSLLAEKNKELLLVSAVVEGKATNDEINECLRDIYITSPQRREKAAEKAAQIIKKLENEEAP